MTIVILALGVLLLQPLQPLLQSPALQPAFDNVVPALFGAMAYKYYRKDLKLAVWPLLMMSILFILAPALQSQTSYSPERFTTAVYQEFVAGKPRLAGATSALEYFGVPDAPQRAQEYAAPTMTGTRASDTQRV